MRPALGQASGPVLPCPRQAMWPLTQKSCPGGSTPGLLQLRLGALASSRLSALPEAHVQGARSPGRDQDREVVGPGVEPRVWQRGQGSGTMPAEAVTPERGGQCPRTSLDHSPTPSCLSSHTHSHHHRAILPRGPLVMDVQELRAPLPTVRDTAEAGRRPPKHGNQGGVGKAGLLLGPQQKAFCLKQLAAGAKPGPAGSKSPGLSRAHDHLMWPGTANSPQVRLAAHRCDLGLSLGCGLSEGKFPTRHSAVPTATARAPHRLLQGRSVPWAMTC